VLFRHPLIRSAVYEGASPDQQRIAHRALASAIPPGSSGDRAWHLAAATIDYRKDTTVSRVDRALKKVRAGARFLQLQVSYEPERLSAFMHEAVEKSLATACALIPSICLVRSPSALRYMDEHVPGITVPAEKLDCGNGTTLLVYGRGAGNKADHTQVRFWSTDIDKDVAVLDANGIEFDEYDTETFKTIDHVVTTPDIGRSAWFKDPDGNTIAVFQPEELIVWGSKPVGERVPRHRWSFRLAPDGKGTILEHQVRVARARGVMGWIQRLGFLFTKPKKRVPTGMDQTLINVKKLAEQEAKSS